MAYLINTLIALAIFAAAALYASVGNAGATSYLAVMALFGFPPEEMKATALTLNILVASIAAYQFYRAGCFSWRVFWPFAITSIPFAYLGGRILLPEPIYRPVVGLVLLYAAFRLVRLPSGEAETHPAASPPLLPALIAGAGIGLMAGLTGVGGGIFLGPLLLLTGWSGAREAAGASAVFNLVNSAAGLSGHLSAMYNLPQAILIWAVAAGIGGWLGAEYGSHRLASRRLQQILALILTLAALRIFLL